MHPVHACLQVDIAAELFPGVIAAPLILGTVAGAGGKFVCDIIRHGWGCLPTPPEAAAPTFIWRSGLMGSAFYWGCAYAAQVLSKEEAAALLISVLVSAGQLLAGLCTTLGSSQPGVYKPRK